MRTNAALPFFLRRKHEVVGAMEITSTTERIHGLLRLEDERLVVQWRVARATERVGSEIRTDREVEPVREVVLPLRAAFGVNGGFAALTVLLAVALLASLIRRPFATRTVDAVA